VRHIVVEGGAAPEATKPMILPEKGLLETTLLSTLLQYQIEPALSVRGQQALRSLVANEGRLPQVRGCILLSSDISTHSP